jgi:hypothetical protein
MERGSVPDAPMAAFPLKTLVLVIRTSAMHPTSMRTHDHPSLMAQKKASYTIT